MAQRTREVSAKVAKYDAAVERLKDSKADLQRQENRVQELRRDIIQRGAAAELAIAPTFHHAQAALDYMSEHPKCKFGVISLSIMPLIVQTSPTCIHEASAHAAADCPADLTLALPSLTITRSQGV